MSVDPTSFWYFVCGILTAANDPAVWSNQAQAWVMRQGIVPAGNAGGFTYFDSVLGGPLADDDQARMVAGDFDDARDEPGGALKVKAVGHSNGCRILLAVLKARPDLVLDELHLIAAAVSDDCQENDLNNIAALGQVRKLVLYCSTGDEVLGLSGISYGDLGKVGPRNMSIALQALLGKAGIVWADPPCKHSDWVGVNFEETMRRVTGVQM